jgi:hypothetical protein
LLSIHSKPNRTGLVDFKIPGPGASVTMSTPDNRPPGATDLV